MTLEERLIYWSRRWDEDDEAPESDDSDGDQPFPDDSDDAGGEDDA